MRTVGIITDIEYDTDTNEIKNIDIAIQDPKTNQIQIITVTDYDKEIDASSSLLEAADYDFFDPVEYMPQISKIKKIISPAQSEIRIIMTIADSIFNDKSLPHWEDIQNRWAEAYSRNLTTLSNSSSSNGRH